jgi:hypothetical protein
MSQGRRIVFGLVILLALGAVVLGLEYVRGRSTLATAAGDATLTPGAIPIYLDGKLVAGFSPNSLEKLEKVSFVEAAEGKTQDGWLLRDVLLTYLPELSLSPGTNITLSSSSRAKSAELTWAEVEDRENMVMFDLSNRGTLKLVSLLEKLDERDEWVQDVDRIELVSP